VASGNVPGATFFGSVLPITVPLRRAKTPSRDTARAMSEENVELTRRVIEGWNHSGAEGVVGLLSPEWVGHPFAEWPSDPIYYGRKGFAKLGGE
jgi:hypothetical protein